MQIYILLRATDKQNLRLPITQPRYAKNVKQEDALRRLRGMYWFSKNYVGWRWKVE